MNRSLVLLAAIAALAQGRASDALEKFWDESAGRTIRRLPVQVVPENAFISLGNGDFKDESNAFLRDRLVRDVFGELSPYNCITLTLRCEPTLDSEAVRRRVADVVAEAHRHGIQVLMDVDARIAREEFFRRWPEDAQRRLLFQLVPSSGGTASFRLVPESCRNHMCYGAKRTYDTTEGHLVNAWAVRRDGAGVIDPTSVRCVAADVHERESSPIVSGRVGGMEDGEDLIVLAEFTHYSADVFSPNLIPFVNGLISEYRTLGADGAMHDEWGFPSTLDSHRAFKSFWYSKHFADAWMQDADGRDMIFDALLMAFPIAGREKERTEAIDRYFRLTFQRNAAIEQAFYDENKRLWGPDVHVTKHPTWYSSAKRSEYFYNGLDWWAAKRDWAQTDESCDVGHCLGMMRVAGGPAWLNEGYGPTGEHYPRTLWRYALCGGRMVYHGIYGGDSLRKAYADPRDRRLHSCFDILACGGALAESRVRLLNCITHSQIASSCAVVFGHSRAMNWLDSAFEDTACDFMHALGAKGWYADAFPTTSLSALRIDEEGWVAAGAQRYPALVLYRISEADRVAWDGLVGGRQLRTKLYLYDPPASSVEAAAAAAGAVCDFLASTNAVGAVRQTPFGATGLNSGSHNRLPDPDGTVTFLDGTVARIKGSSPNPGGDPVDGILDVCGRDVVYAATGLFAARMGKNGINALAAGALRSVHAPGLRLELDEPRDIVLLKKDGKWRGLVQVAAPLDEIPAPLRVLTDDWRILVQPEVSADSLETLKP